MHVICTIFWVIVQVTGYFLVTRCATRKFCSTVNRSVITKYTALTFQDNWVTSGLPWTGARCELGPRRRPHFNPLLHEPSCNVDVPVSSVIRTHYCRSLFEQSCTALHIYFPHSGMSQDIYVLHLLLKLRLQSSSLALLSRFSECSA